MEQEFQPAAGTAVIDRGAQLLTLVLESDAPRGLTDLAQDAGLPKSTASRLLNALERNGLVEQQGVRGRFRAGPVVLRFAGRGLAGRNLMELAERPMGALADATGETINLGVPGVGGVAHLAHGRRPRAASGGAPGDPARRLRGRDRRARARAVRRRRAGVRREGPRR